MCVCVHRWCHLSCLQIGELRFHGLPVCQTSILESELVLMLSLASGKLPHRQPRANWPLTHLGLLDGEAESLARAEEWKGGL